MIRLVRVVLLTMCVVLISIEANAQEQRVPRKSGSTALLLSFGGTAVPWLVAFGAASELETAPAVLMTVGMLAGPSFGHFYAGRPGRALASTGVRLGALVVIVAGVAQCFEDLFGDDPSCSGGSALAVAGSALFIGSTVYDIVTAPASARRFNREHPAVGVVPVLRDGHMQVALVAHVPF